MATSTSNPDTTAQDGADWERRVGKTNYWVHVTRDDFGSSATWRLSIIHKPARANKAKPPLYLVQFSPQNPLFTFDFEGQRYPLMIGKIAVSRGGKIIIGGSRKVGARLNSVLTWVADLSLAEESGTAYIRISSRFRCPGNSKKAAALGVKVPIIAYQPEFIESRVPKTTDITVAAAWIERAETAIGLIAKSKQVGEASPNESSLRADFDEVDLSGRTFVQLVIALRNATSQTEAQQLIRTEAAEAAEPVLDKTVDLQAPLMQRAVEGIAQLLDSKNCTIVGKERWYFRASEEFDYGPGFPYFTAEASPAIMRWNKIYPNDSSELTARLTARGVAADFAVIVGQSGAEGNKGAFWDCAKGTPDSLRFSTFDRRSAYGIASNSRIAHALFQMFEASHDPLYRQAAMNTCHWLILKQNDAGYYDGPFIDAASGKFTERSVNFDGLLAIRPLVAAFRTSGNEVFIKSAWKIANFAKTTLLPKVEASCLFGQDPEPDCPVALAAAVHSLLDLDNEAPKDDLRSMLTVIGNWLALCRFDEQSHKCLNYDGSYSGALECAVAALRLFTFTGSTRWFRLGYSLIKQTATTGTVNWRFAEAAVQLLLSLGTLLPGGSVDLSKQTVAISWCKFAPDAAAAQYYEVRNVNREPVDFLPLICRETNQALLLILCPRDTTAIELIKRNQVSHQRVPIWDLVTGFPCGLDIPIHMLPNDLGAFSVIRIDP